VCVCVCVVCVCLCVCVCVCVCVEQAAAKEGPPKPGLTRSDSSLYLSLAPTADRWIALIHHRKKKKTERKRGMEGWRDGERERERESPQDDSPALLSVQRAGV